MLIPPHPHPHRCHPRTLTRRHHSFLGQTYYALSPPHSALIHHRFARHLPPHPHTHCRNPRPHTRRHHWFPGRTSRIESRAIIAGWRWGWHHARRFHHLHLLNPRYPLASRDEVHLPCNCCLSGCLGQCFRSQAPQAPLRRSNNQDE